MLGRRPTRHLVAVAAGAVSLLAGLLVTSGSVVHAAAVTRPTIAAASPEDVTSDDIYDDDTVVHVRLTIPDSGMDDLRDEPGEYVAAELVIAVGDAEYGPYAIGARLKGVTSFRDLDGKAAWKLKFAHVVAGQRLFGLKGMTLNNMVQDPSMIAESLAYRLFRELDVPAPRTGFAYVSVNGAEYGLYANVEPVDSVFADRWFPSTRHILEGSTGSDVTASASSTIEVDEGSKSDLSDLLALVTAVAADDDWSTAVASVTDLAELTRMWAVEHYVHHWDGYSLRRGDVFPSNYYLHSTADGRFAMVPSGTDQTWGPSSAGMFGEVGTGVLFRRCVTDLPCRARYVEAVGAVADAAAGLGLADHARAAAVLIRPWVTQDPRREVSLDQVEQAQAARIDVIGGRLAQARAWLAAPFFVLSDPGGGGGGSPAPPPPADVPLDPPPLDPPPPADVPLDPPPLDPPPRAPVPLTAGQLMAATGPQLATVSAAALAAVDPPAWAVLTPRQARHLTVVQLAALPAASVRRLRPAVIGSFSAAQLGALSPAAFGSLRPAQLRALRPAQVARLTARHLIRLDPMQAAALRADVVGALTSAQLRGLNRSPRRVLVPRTFSSGATG